MSDDSQALNTTPVLPSNDLVEPRRIMTKKELRFRQMEDINYLIDLKVPKTEIARRMGISAKTLHNLIHEYRGKDLKALHQEAVDMASKRVARKLDKITEMTLDQTLTMKDRVAGLSILKDTGVLDTVRPSGVKRDEESRITFEFNFAPPPWAPKAMSEPKKVKVIENKPELPAIAASVDVPPRD